MTEYICSKCGEPAYPVFKTVDYNRRISRETFDYYRCSRCGFVFLSSIPQDLGRYYPPNYYDIPRSADELASKAKRLQQWKLDTVRRFSDRGRLLEVGPAYGLFAYLAKQSGYDVSAIEMDSRCCAFLRDTVGISVTQSDDAAAAMSTMPTMDVIVLWQVIEHLIDPWSVLRAAARLLSPGGILVLDTPNPESFQFNLLKGRWTHVDAPRHVSLIPAAVLAGYLREYQMNPLLLTAAHVSSNGFNGFGWAYSLGNLFSNRALATTASWAGRVLAKLLIPIERTGWRGSTYVGVFRKEV